jgi:hypothetical protein
MAVFAFAKIEANLISVSNNEGIINKNLKDGISGVVLCPYLKKEIICARAVAFGNKVGFFDYSLLKNDAFALPIIRPQKGDKIVFGKDYGRILIIAPNQITYLKIKKMFSNKTIISPDVLAAFLTSEPTANAFRKFAQEMNIGLYVFAINNKLYEVDSFSFYAIKTIPFKFKAKYKKAFFTYFDNFDLKPENYLKIIRGIHVGK